MTVELSLRGVRAGYGPVEVLHGIDLDVPSAAVTAVLGPNGAGKTTLLGVIGGLLRARAGELRWRDARINERAAHERAQAGMLLVPERRGVFPQLSVRDNLEVFAGSRRDWTAAFDSFPVLAERLDQAAGSLSGGEQQMLALTRALVRRPRLLLLDEISFGLAPRVAARLFSVVTELARTGTTVVLVEQHRSQALRLADVVYLLGRGEVVFAGEPAELAVSSPRS